MLSLICYIYKCLHDFYCIYFAKAMRVLYAPSDATKLNISVYILMCKCTANIISFRYTRKNFLFFVAKYILANIMNCEIWYVVLSNYPILYCKMRDTVVKSLSIFISFYQFIPVFISILHYWYKYIFRISYYTIIYLTKICNLFYNRFKLFLLHSFIYSLYVCINLVFYMDGC